MEIHEESFEIGFRPLPVPFQPRPAPVASPAPRRRVVITGIGVVAPSGVGTEALWELLVSGRSAVRPVEGFDASEYPVRIAAQIPGFDPLNFMEAPKARHLGRFCHLAIAATRLAVEDSHVAHSTLASSRTGFFLGTGAGPADVWWHRGRAFVKKGVRAIHPAFPILASPHSGASQASSEFGITGPVVTVSSECPSGLDAIASGCRQIRAGEIDVALTGAVDAPICELLFGSLARSGMLAAGNDAPGAACRPFDRRRCGFVLGEAGAMLVLEDADRAYARGATVYGEIAGFGSGRDRPTYIGETDPSGRGFLAAMRLALEDARLDAHDIDHVSAHAPGVVTTDLAEIRALKDLFGARRRTVPVNSIKGALGQPLAAAGVLQVATTLLAFRNREIPPTLNCDEVDPECELDVVRGACRPGSPSSVLVTSHGFGGNTTSLVIRSGPH